MIYCINPAAQQAAPWSELKALLKDVRSCAQWNGKLAGLCFLYICVYPRLGKVLSRRKQMSLLYRLTSVLRRPATPHALPHADTSRVL